MFTFAISLSLRRYINLMYIRILYHHEKNCNFWIYNRYIHRTLSTNNISTTLIENHVLELQNLTGWTENEVIKAIKKNPKLEQKNATNITKVFKLLNDEGIDKQQIGKAIKLLTYSPQTVKTKLSLIKELDIKNESKVLFILISVNKLKDILKEKKEYLVNFKERLQYFYDNLEIEMNELIALLELHPHLVTYEFYRIKEIMEMLKEAGVSSDAICKDLWIFRNSTQQIANRIKQCKLAGAQVKTWMLRCPEQMFLNTLDRWSKNIQILGSCNTTDYLAERLNCSKEYIQVMNEKNPRLLLVQPFKLKQIIDFLFEKGFTPQQIRSAPRIFNYSLDTFEKRWKEFMELNFYPSSLSVFYNSYKQHHNLITKVKQFKNTDAQENS